MSTTSNVNEEISVSDYQIFDDASNDVGILYSCLDESIKVVSSSKSIICSDDVFMGPIAESCRDALDILNNRMGIALENYLYIKKYFGEIVSGYKNGDKKADQMILYKDEKGFFDISHETSSEVINQVCKNAMKFCSDPRSTYALGWDKTRDYFYGDCFGFVLACYEGVTDLQYNPQTMGGTNPATATSYLVNNGKFTQLPFNGSTQLQPGDILICPTKGAEHAELYIGNGQFASAPSAARPMYHPYYNFGATYILRLNQNNLVSV